VLPLIGSVLFSAVGQLGIKLAIDVGKKLFAKDTAETNAEDFPAQLKRQVEKSAASTPSAQQPSLSIADLPAGPQAPLAAAAANVSRSLAEVADAYERFEATWPGRSTSMRVISPIQTP